VEKEAFRLAWGGFPQWVQDNDYQSK